MMGYNVVKHISTIDMECIENDVYIGVNPDICNFM